MRLTKFCPLFSLNSTTPFTTNNSLYLNQGIVVEDATGSAQAIGSLKITGNTVRRALNKAILAINIQNGLQITFNGNVNYPTFYNPIGAVPELTVFAAPAQPKNAVIHALACQNADIQGNENITCATLGVSPFNSNIHGILIDNSPNVNVSCNAVVKCRWAVSYNQNCMPSVFGRNTMTHCYSALNLFNGATIGAQGSLTSGPTHNNWTTCTYYTFNQSTPNLPSNSRLYLYNNLIGGINKHLGIPSNGPNCSSNIIYGVQYDYKPACGSIVPFGTNSPSLITGCVVGVGGCTGGNQGGRLDTLSSGRLRPVYYDYDMSSFLGPERTWHNRRYLWERILLDTLYNTIGDTAIQHFYTQNAATGMGKLTQTGLALKKYNIAAAQAANSFLPANNLEAKQQQVNTIKIKLNDTTHSLALTPADTALLKQLANGCPLLDGRALQEARTLLNLFSGMQLQYTDNCPANVSQRLAYTEEEENKTEAATEETNISLYPNPNTGDFTISYNIEQNATLYIFDAQGKQVYSLLLSAEQKSIEVNNLNLANGIYMYKVLNGGNVLHNGKLIILK